MSKTGSEMKYGRDDPRVCCLCHKPVAMTSPWSQGTTFYHQGDVHLAIHVACGNLADVLLITNAGVAK